MREMLDPKRHYKKAGKFKIPEYSQMGTIIEGPTEFFSSRLNKGDRRKTLVDEALEAEDRSKRFKTKYLETQKKKQSGKKAFYKKLQARRKPARG
jgi:hypothetical protein